jgi:hypothetical protein
VLRRARPGIAAEFFGQSADDARGDLVLNGKDVFDFRVKAIRPERRAAGRLKHLHRQSQFIVETLKLAFEHRVNL